MEIIIKWFFSLLFILFFVFLLPINITIKSEINGKGIKNIKCACKYYGPYFGELIDVDKNEKVENCLIVCWWETKKKAPSGEFIYETIKTFKTYTDEEGKFFIPKYPEKKDKYICCPKVIIYKKEYLNFINFSRKIDCFKKKEGCTIYLKKLSDENKAEILKIIPVDVREILKKSFEDKKEIVY